MPTVEKQDSRRVARLFRNGRNQAVRIPREMELPGEEVVLYKEGVRLIVEPVEKRRVLLDLLDRWKPIDDRFPDVDAGLRALDDVDV